MIVFASLILLCIYLSWMILQYISVNGLVPEISDPFGTDRANREVFAFLGDFFGGILNPILTAVTIIILIISLRQSQRALNISERQLNETLMEMSKQRAEDQFYRLIDVLKARKESYEQIESLMKKNEGYKSIIKLITDNIGPEKILDMSEMDKEKSHFSYYVMSAYSAAKFMEDNKLTDTHISMLLCVLDHDLLSLATTLQENEIKVRYSDGTPALLESLAYILFKNKPTQEHD